MKYFSEWKNSWIDLFNNLKLLVPDLLFIIFEILFAGLILWVSGLFPVVKTLYLEKDISVIGNSLVKVIVSAVIFVVTSFVFGAGVRAIKYNYICDVLKKKKVELRKLWEYSGEGFLKIIYVRILLFLIALGGVIILGLTSVISKYVFIFLLPFFVIIYLLGVLFVYPIMFLKDKKALESIKSSFSYFRNNILHVIVIWAVISLTSVALTSITQLVSQVVFVIPLNLVIGLFAGVWSLLYLFKAL